MSNRKRKANLEENDAKKKLVKKISSKKVTPKKQAKNAKKTSVETGYTQAPLMVC
jgi:hypothetical protein